jgi:hypothetical protein
MCLLVQNHPRPPHFGSVASDHRTRTAKAPGTGVRRIQRFPSEHDAKTEETKRKGLIHQRQVRSRFQGECFQDQITFGAFSDSRQPNGNAQ